MSPRPAMPHAPHSTSIRFGLIADPQYADAPPAGARFYRESLGKLRDAAEDLNAFDPRFVLHVGDAIDRDFTNFPAVMSAFAAFRAPVVHLAGNHDYEVSPAAKSRVLAAMGRSAAYETRHDLLPGWRVILLDGTAISTFAHVAGTPPYETAERLTATVEAAGLPQAKPWNGGLGEAQLDWLDRELAAADAAGQRVLLACHFPAFPIDSHNLLDDQALLAVIDRHACVNLYLCGHHHAGGYALRDGVHYVTLCGMVETQTTTAYALAELLPDRLVIRGRGREPSRELPLRRLPVGPTA